jgi:hypothetical protein
MPAASEAWVARQFSALSDRERHRFLAALWGAQGYETSVDGGSVLVHGDQPRKLAVVGRWPLRSNDADIVVGTRDTDRARAYANAHDAEFVSPAVLRRLLLYGIERDVADELTRKYFGTAVTEGPSSTGRSPLSPPALLSVLTIVLVVVIAASLGTVPAASSTPQISDPSESAFPAANQSPDSAPLSLSSGQSCASSCVNAEDDTTSKPETVNTQRLVRLHQTQLTRQPQHVTFVYTGPSNTSFKSGVVRERISLRTNQSHGRYVRQQRILNDSGAPVEWTDDVYISDNGVWIHRNDRTRPLRGHVWRDLQRSLLWPYYTIPEQMHVSQVQLQGMDLYKMTAETDSVERADYRAVAYVTPDDRLVYLSISYEHPETGESVSIVIEYGALDSDTKIPPPSWY